MSDSDTPQVTLIGSPDAQGFTRVTRAATRKNRPHESPIVHPEFNSPNSRHKSDETEEDQKPPAIASRSTDDKFDDIMKIMMSLQADLRQSHNRLDDLDGHLGTIDSNLEVIDNSVTHLKLDVHAIENIQADEEKASSRRQARSSSGDAPSREENRSDFPRFSGYIGTRTSLQHKVSPEEYYKFVLPAGGNSTSSYVNVTQPIPNGTSTSHDSTGNGTQEHGLFALSSNTTIDLGKFMKTLDDLQLAGDDVLSLRDFYHGLRMALNTCGKHHIDILPMFEVLRPDSKFDSILLPSDADGQLNHTDYRYNSCLRMYHSFGQVILVALTTKKLITPALAPKAYSILLSNKNLNNGWELLWIILRKRAPHLGGTNIDVHDLITNLKIVPGESLAIFCNRAMQLEHTIVYSGTTVPATRLFYKFMTNLMTCSNIRMYIATQYADLRRHITQFGENVKYPVATIQEIYEYLDQAQLDDATLTPDSTKTSSPNPSMYQSSVPQAHMAKLRTNHDIPSCDCCLRRGHLADTCFARGLHFLSPDIQRRISQYNAIHGDRPKVAPTGSSKPPPVKYPPKTYRQGSSPAHKPNIKVLIGDITDDDQLITDADPALFEIMDKEDEFEEFVDAVDAPSPPDPSLRHMSANFDIMPILPDYDGIFDPAELRMLQGN
jgi:hypothetical protein